MTQIPAQEAASMYVRSGNWMVWLDSMPMSYMKAFWMWVDAYA